jgi:hypothetical protein
MRAGWQRPAGSVPVPGWMPGAPEANFELRLIASSRERVYIHFFRELEIIVYPVAVEVGPGGEAPQNHILGIAHWSQLGLLVHTVLSPLLFLVATHHVFFRWVYTPARRSKPLQNAQLLLVAGGIVDHAAIHLHPGMARKRRGPASDHYLRLDPVVAQEAHRDHGSLQT